MQSIGVLLRNGGRRPPMATFSHKGRRKQVCACVAQLNKNGRDCSRPFHLANVLPQRGGAMPGGGGGSDAVPPLSRGVMRRTVTRRLIRLGPLVCSFRYCAP